MFWLYHSLQETGSELTLVHPNRHGLQDTSKSAAILFMFF
jgi:hypothetical protein